MNFLNNIPPITKNLLFINVIVFLLQLTFPWVDENLTLYFFKSPDFEPYQLLTHMFMHSTGDFRHLFFNMFGVYMFGSAVEQRMGGQRFLLYYLLTGFGAVILHSLSAYVTLEQGNAFEYLAHLKNTSTIYYADLSMISDTNKSSLLRSIFRENNIPDGVQISSELYNQVYNLLAPPVVGASGALFGLLAAFALFFPNQSIYLMFIPVPIKAKYFVLLYAGYELYRGFSNSPTDNVAHFAHLGGALFGFLIIRQWRKQGYL